MAGNTFGTIFRVTTFGESHGIALGAVVDGCPAGLPLCEEDIQRFLDRRKPGTSAFTTQRKEGDICRILSGVFEGRTTGTAITVMIENTDQRSHDYSAIMHTYRPGHADYGYDMKYGFRDYRGGGRSSGRETIGRVIGGAIASKILEVFGIRIHAYTEAVGPFEIGRVELSECCENALWMPDNETAAKAEAYLQDVRAEKDSSGCRVACSVKGVPAGIGEPVFDKLDAELAKAVMSIGAVKGIEFGSGFGVAAMKGSENNDPFRIANGRTVKSTNHAGGILGGMSDGSEICFRAAFKPTPSIAQLQKTINDEGSETEIEIRGRHDPIIGPRAVVVVECMTAITLLDLMMRNAVCRMEHLEKIYGEKEL